MQSDDHLTPWYKQLWPWLIMLPPAAAVIGGIVTFILAGGPPEMVPKDAVESTPAKILEAQSDERATHD